MAEPGLYDPAYEQRQWDAYEQAQTRRARTAATLPPGAGERVAAVARRHPHLAPGVALGLGLAFPEPNHPMVDQIARQAARDLSDDPLWKDLAEGFYHGVKAGARGFLTGAAYPFQVVDRGVRSIAAASDRASRGGGFSPSTFMRELPRAYNELPDPALEMVVGAWESGRTVSLGDGILPAGEIGEERDRRTAAVTFGSTGMPVTVGDMFAGAVAQPGTRAYDFTKTVTGTAWELGADPLLAVDKATRASLAARKAFTGVAASDELRAFGMVVGSARRTVLPEVQLDNWLASERGQAATAWLRDTTDFEEIRGRVGSAEVAARLTRATTDQEVHDLVRHYAGRGRLSSEIRSPLDYRISKRVEDTWLATVWDQAHKALDPDDYRRVGQWTPGDAINLEDPEQAAEQVVRWFANWKAPKETASRYALELTERIIEGDHRGAWQVFRDAQGELANDLVARGHDADVVKSLTRLTVGDDFVRGTDIRAYSLNEIGDYALQPLAERDVLIGGVVRAKPMPHLDVEFTDRTIPLSHNREIRRATSTLSRLVKIPGVGDAVHPVKGAVWNVHDALWSVQRGVWMPLQLVTRIAWPMRITGEEQARMASVGLDSMFHHPISYLGWALGAETKVGRGVTKAAGAVGVKPRDLDVLGQPIREAAEFREALVRGRPKAFGGAQAATVGPNWRRIRLEDAPVAVADAAHRIEMGKLWSSPAAQKVAESILAGDNELNGALRWFWRSDLHDYLLKANPEAAKALATPKGARGYLRTVANRIRQNTGEDLELIESIATRRLRGMDVYDVALDKKAVGKILREKPRPEWLPVPVDIAERQGRKPILDTAVTNLFYALGAVPSNTLSRSPAFKQFYWQKVAELVAYADDGTRAQMLAQARAAKLPRELIADMAARVKGVDGAARPDALIESLEEIDGVAKADALRQVHGLLYNLDEKGQTAEAMRLVAPFGSAWQEIGKTWLKLLTTNPLLLRRGEIIVDNAREGGFFMSDPQSGEEMYVTPGGGLLESLFFDDPDDRIDVQLPARLQGLNLFAGSVVPGLGPVMQFPLATLMPDKPEFDDVRDLLLPFGSPVNTPGDFADLNKLVGGILPAYWRKALTAWSEGGFDDKTWAAHKADVIRALLATKQFDMSTEEGARELDEQASRIAKSTLLIRAVGQGVLPTGFKYDFRVKADSPEADKLVRQVLGSEAKLGRTDGNFFSTAVLGAFYRQLVDDNDGDSYAATSQFLTMLGHDASDWENYPWVAGIRQAKTTSLNKGAMTAPGREWERRNAAFVEAHRMVAGYFAPEDTAPDAFDIDAFGAAVAKGDSVYLTGEQFIRRSHGLLGSMIYRAQSARAEGMPELQARAYKAQVRAWLDERLAYWRFDDANLGIPQSATRLQKIEALESALKHPSAKAAPQGEVLGRYLDLRDRALEQVLAEDGMTREQALGRLATANATAHLREWLVRWGDRLSRDVPEFGPMWEDVLRGEVEEDVEEVADAA